MPNRPLRSPSRPAAHGASPRGGFTLVELLVVVSIVGILAAIAYPSYRTQVEKTRRADAQAVLMQSAQYMERIYTESGCYNRAADGDCDADEDSFSPPYPKSPIDGTETYYLIGVEDLDGDEFTLRATPQGSEEDAGILEIDQAGRRGRDLNGDDDTADVGEDHW